MPSAFSRLGRVMGCESRKLHRTELGSSLLPGYMSCHLSEMPENLSSFPVEIPDSCDSHPAIPVFAYCRNLLKIFHNIQCRYKVYTFSKLCSLFLKLPELTSVSIDTVAQCRTAHLLIMQFDNTKLSAETAIWHGNGSPETALPDEN